MIGPVFMCMKIKAKDVIKRNTLGTRYIRNEMGSVSYETFCTTLTLVRRDLCEVITFKIRSRTRELRENNCDNSGPARYRE